MKQIIFYSIAILLFTACNNNHEHIPVSNDVSIQDSTTANFFPVTRFLKGQIREIKTGGTNPLSIVTIDKHTDSSWLKIEDLDKEFAPFLEPVIDTANLASLFTEKKFLDQTLNAFTFTYDAKGVLPDSMQLLHWDIYVTPESNKVKRIYLVKKLSADTQQQLTWVTDEWAKIVTIKSLPEGNTIIEKEQTIKWRF